MAFAYAAVLFAHSWLRWGVLATTTLCAATSWRGWRQRRPFTPADQRRLRLCVGLVDTQLLLGVILYAGLSPITAAARLNVDAAMHNAILRFFLVEHPLAMLIGVVVLHVGGLRAKRLGDGPLRHRAVSRTVAAALLCFVIGVPWPRLPYARPLARSIGVDASSPQTSADR